jgi:serine/threonine-protein kinase HipA
MIEKLDVHLDHYDTHLLCGQLVLQGKDIFFKYSKEYIEKGFNISPFKLKFNQEIQASNLYFFENLFGVFHDSLPDGWGQLLMQRYFQDQKIPINDRNVLLQLSCLSKTSKGGLFYKPSILKSKDRIQKTIDDLHNEAISFYNNQSQHSIDDIFTLGGSSGGARPKIDAWIHTVTKEIHFVKQGEECDLYLVKFKSDTDCSDIAEVEFSYMEMAKLAGIDVPKSTLIKGNEGRSYFATKRFDREGIIRIHTISAAGLLHDNFRNSTIDYGHLMDAAFRLDPQFASYEKVLRLAIFNVLAHNKDDHSKNFSFIADRSSKYFFSPAYDLTFSYGINAYRSTAVAGEQKNPTITHIKELATHFGVKNVNSIIDEVYEAIKCWPKLAIDNGVSQSTLDEIQNTLVNTEQQFFKTS